MGKIVSKLRQAATFLARDTKRTRKRAEPASRKMKKPKEKSRYRGAWLRALLVVAVSIFPAVAIPTTAPDTAQSMVLLALVAGGIIFAEYASEYPALIEFRFAAPFNRTRFALLAAIVLMLSMILRNAVEPSALNGFVAGLASVFGMILSFPGSPVNLLLGALPDTATAAHIAEVRDGAALAMVMAIATVGGFVAAIRMNIWPMGTGPFNVWINLPTFDPTAGNDVVQRLHRHARINIALGIVMPFLLPTAVIASGMLMKPVTLMSPMGYVWGIALWSFLPAAFVMRGVAMNRVAHMIHDSRRRLADHDGGHYVAA